ncbi:hypothetical protein SAMN05216294_2514 [Flagellimonas zhangzhouensis]|uniref:Uncharacterized protein n=1 Tax=Flagellimonas zhangzhouensis TaxID=1073328 RepID=A0A1H2SLJ9_9FLAO|nr:hypothetical protein SAMN05216294_2514 [Allomuricauda zhangzhouensis]SDW32438.1 hypothetical protein SAMN04487892_1155 [Allomuricauda zhangzhouensis]
MEIFRRINHFSIHILGTRELLNYLEKLEIGLSSFSYEELGVVEAGELKKSFELFKHGLESKVFGISEMEQLQKIYQKVGIESTFAAPLTPAAQDRCICLIKALEKTRLTDEQAELVNELKQIAQNIPTTTDQKNMTPPKNFTTNFQFIERTLESDYTSNKINLKPVLEDCMGQMELMEELVKVFKQNILEFIGSAKIHLMNRNFEALDNACQKVGPSLQMMKIRSLLEITDQISRLCKTDNDMKHHAFLYDQFLQEYPIVEEQVDFEMEVFRTM